MRIDDEGPVQHEQQRVPVRLRRRCDLAANIARGARSVVRYHLLAQLLAEVIGNDAATGVGHTPWREGNDQADRPAGIR